MLTERRKLLILVAIIVLVVSTAVVVALTLTGGKKAEKSTAVTGSSTPEVESVPTEHGETDEDEAKEKQIAQYQNAPIMRQLPHYTPNWNLTNNGFDNNRYQLAATVRVPDGSDPQPIVDQARPQILAFIKASGQPEGSYDLSVDTTSQLPSDPALFPVMEKIPHAQGFWSLTYQAEPFNGSVLLNANVTVYPGQDPTAQANAAHDQMDAWLQSIGQAPGTYFLLFHSNRSDESNG